MASDGRQLPQRPRAIRIPLLALAAALLALAALAPGASASAEVVYDNPPAAESAEALSFEGTETAELGTLVRLAGSDRLNPQVSVAMADSGAAAAVPITLSLYAAAADGEPGALLARDTQTFEFAGDCTVQTVEFSFAGITLPDEVIISVAFESDAVGVVLAGPAAAGTNPREAEGVYRAAAADPGEAPVFGFEAEAMTWEGRQPAFTVAAAAAAPAPVVAPAAAATANAAAPANATTLAAPRLGRREFRIPPSKRMVLSFTRATARIAGPGALVQVRCTGASAARCIGTLSLTAAGAVHKVPYSIGKGRRQYLVVPLGSDLELIDNLGAARATATASTVQAGGAAVTTKRALKLK